MVTRAGTVTSDEPIDSVNFFYVHEFGFSAGVATEFNFASSAARLS